MFENVQSAAKGTLQGGGVSPYGTPSEPERVIDTPAVHSAIQQHVRNAAAARQTGLNHYPENFQNLTIEIISEMAGFTAPIVAGEYLRLMVHTKDRPVREFQSTKPLFARCDIIQPCVIGPIDEVQYMVHNALL